MILKYTIILIIFFVELFGNDYTDLLNSSSKYKKLARWNNKVALKQAEVYSWLDENTDVMGGLVATHNGFKTTSQNIIYIEGRGPVLIDDIQELKNIVMPFRDEFERFSFTMLMLSHKSKINIKTTFDGTGGTYNCLSNTITISSQELLDSTNFKATLHHELIHAGLCLTKGFPLHWNNIQINTKNFSYKNRFQKYKKNPIYEVIIDNDFDKISSHFSKNIKEHQSLKSLIELCVGTDNKNFNKKMMALRQINSKSDQMLFDAEAIPTVFELFYENPENYKNKSCIKLIDKISIRFLNFASKINL